MAEKLLSVGLDVGTTTTQLIVSEITVENRASGFCVPEMDITGRKVLYESPVHFTPLVGENLVDGDTIARLVEEEYKNAGITPAQVDTGAVIVTGETSRKENAAAVLKSLAGLAGDFVVATAGPDLESVLAAKGAGAVEFSEKTGKSVLHMDIGGGTSNLAYIRDGRIVATGCLNVGGRLVKVEDGKIAYVSPVIEALQRQPLRPESKIPATSPYTGEAFREGQDPPLQVGSLAEEGKLGELAELLVQALEMAAGLREKTALWDVLWTQECVVAHSICARADMESAPTNSDGSLAVGPWVVSFSGGVAECIEKDHDDFAFGDMGPILGRAIRKSRLCQGEFMLGINTIRATVIGAGCHSAQLSGSTVFCQNVALPLKNLTVVAVTEAEQLDAGVIAGRLAARDAEKVVLAIPGFRDAGYEQVAQLADAIAEGFGNRDILVCVEQDMAKALGQRLALRLGADRPCLCIDRVRLTEGSFLDVGQSVGPCMSVVVKTLVFNN